MVSSNDCETFATFAELIRASYYIYRTFIYSMKLKMVSYSPILNRYYDSKTKADMVK